MRYREFDLKYGDGMVRLEVPAHAAVLSLSEAADEKPFAEAKFAERLQKALQNDRADFSRVGIAIADKTRLCGYPRFLPVLVRELVAAGASPDALTFYIAYGTHPPQSNIESLRAYGEVYDRCRFVAHHCDRGNEMTDLGTTVRGTRIRVRRDFVESTFKITFGAISHHYFAGYGGGRKLVFPGLGARESIYHNHSLFVASEPGCLESKCQPGILDGNPLAEDLQEIASAIPADLAIHGILNSTGKVVEAIIGTGYDDFTRACARHAERTEVCTAEDYDLVVASCGGDPKDINFIQAHKSLHNATMFVRDGGTVLLLAKCRDGIGSQTFLPWFGEGGIHHTWCRLRQSYSGNGGTALATMAKSQRCHVALLTDLPHEICARIGIARVPLPITGPVALGRLAALDGMRLENSRIAVIPNASILVPNG